MAKVFILKMLATQQHNEKI